MSNKKIIYQCFKAYEESTRYYKDGNSVIFRSVYHYAELEYSDKCILPKKSIDGNFYSFSDPIRAEVGDVYLDRVDFIFIDKLAEVIYKQQLSEMTINDFEQSIILLGYDKEVYQVMYGKGTTVINK